MNPPQLAKGEVTVLVNVGDDQADGIHVGGEEHLGARSLFVDDEIAQGINPAVVRIGFSQTLDGGGNLPLISGRAVAGVEHLNDRQIIHCIFSSFHG